MTVAGSDNYLDAPVLEPGTSSAYTPNTGYGLESGEPTAWGGKTAWWRINPTETAFLFVDVLYSTGSTRAWVYRAFVPDPTFAQLFLVNDPGADTQGGFNAAAGGTYWIRLDSDGSDVSYVLSVGGYQYDEYTERRYLHRPSPDDPTYPWHVREEYFYPGQIVASDPDTNAWSAHYYGLVDEHVDGAPGGTAVMHVEAFADDVIADYPAFNSGDWYDVEGGGHPILVFSSSSVGGDTVEVPDGYEVHNAPLVVTLGSTEGPPIPAETDGEVPQITLMGEFEADQPLRFFDDNGSPGGEIVVGPSTEVTLALPVGFAADTALTDYHSGELVFTFRPNLRGSISNPQPYPVGSWFVFQVAIDFLIRSEEPLPYEPPPPPLAEILSVIRQYPRDDGLGLSSAPRTFPPPKANRLIGGYQ